MNPYRTPYGDPDDCADIAFGNPYRKVECPACEREVEAGEIDESGVCEDCAQQEGEK